MSVDSVRAPACFSVTSASDTPPSTEAVREDNPLPQPTHHTVGSIWQRLSKDPFSLIAAHLYPEELLRIERTCKAWQSLVNPQDQRVWKQQHDGLVDVYKKVMERALQDIFFENCEECSEKVRTHVMTIITDYASSPMRVEHSPLLYRNLFVHPRPFIAVLPEDWKLWAKVEKEESLRPNIYHILAALKDPCMCTYIPPQCNGKPYSVRTLYDEVMSTHGFENRSSHGVLRHFWDVPIGRGGYYLLTRECCCNTWLEGLIPNPRQVVAAKYDGGALQGWRSPPTFLEVVTCFIMEAQVHGIRGRTFPMKFYLTYVKEIYYGCPILVLINIYGNLDYNVDDGDRNQIGLSSAICKI